MLLTSKAAKAASARATALASKLKLAEATAGVLHPVSSLSGLLGFTAYLRTFLWTDPAKAEGRDGDASATLDGAYPFGTTAAGNGLGATAADDPEQVNGDQQSDSNAAKAASLRTANNALNPYSEEKNSNFELRDIETPTGEADDVDADAAEPPMVAGAPPLDGTEASAGRSGDSTEAEAGAGTPADTSDEALGAEASGQVPVGKIYTGTEGADLVSGTDFNDEFRTYGGDDLVSSLGGDDVIDTGAGDDRVVAGAGNDSVFTGTGNDMAFGGNGADFINLGAGDDLGMGGAGNDTILGEDGNDTLFGEAGNDTLDGGAGQDTIDGGAGDDLMLGGAGDDTMSGGAGNDTIDGGAGNDVIDGGAGDDTVTAGAGDDVVSTGEGDDLVFSGSGNDQIDTGAGDDTVVAESGNNTITTGEGNDTVTTGAGNDLVDAGDGNDIIKTGSGNDVVHGGRGNDWIRSDDDDDHDDDDDEIYGEDGDDEIWSGRGRDYVSDGWGSDRIDVGDDDDHVEATEDHDSDYFLGGHGTDTLDFSSFERSLRIDTNSASVRYRDRDEGWYKDRERDDDDRDDDDREDDWEDRYEDFEYIRGGRDDDEIVFGYREVELEGNDGADVFIFNDMRDGSEEIVGFTRYEIKDFQPHDRLVMGRAEFKRDGDALRQLNPENANQADSNTLRFEVWNYADQSGVNFRDEVESRKVDAYLRIDRSNDGVWDREITFMFSDDDVEEGIFVTNIV